MVCLFVVKSKKGTESNFRVSLEGKRKDPPMNIEQASQIFKRWIPQVEPQVLLDLESKAISVLGSLKTVSYLADLVDRVYGRWPEL